jgi:CRP-like cAMP-binding protein
LTEVKRCAAAAATIAGVPSTPISPREFLRNIPLFREIEEEDLARIAAATTQVRAPAGATLFRRGDACHGFHVVVYGLVKLALSDAEGAEKIVEVIGPGMSFGEAVMFLERPYLVTATALEDSMLLVIGRQAVFAEIERSPVFARRMLAGLSMRLHRLVADIESYTLKSGTERLIEYLLGDASGAIKPQGGAVELDLPTSKGAIAARLSITREHLSRVLHDLAARGLIEVHGRKIRVPDVDRLRRAGRPGA